ncbi:MAG: FAD-dependent oxidoreductase [Candidatus Heimdallarchaeota archaeon]|nr:MAG: FAD-dependent oxidoreductase [Candidatus Heimdallarchaeota archaeon]
MLNLITEHPILSIPELKEITFFWEGKTMKGIEGMVISSVLFMNGVKIFGHHPKDNSPQGIFCANNQCAQCTVLVNGRPVKSCMTLLKAGMEINSCQGLPELLMDDSPTTFGVTSVVKTDILVIGAGPAGLSATKILGEKGLKVILVDDKDRVGGKLVLQTHKFFGSTEDVYAGKRGIDIAEILGKAVESLPTVDIWLSSTVVAIFSDKLVGIVKENEYILVIPDNLFIATGAREKMLVFPGDTLPGVYGAGAFQTLVNRDLVKAADKIFIVGGGNVGLIAGYHALQAGMEVIGLVEALPQCGGYKVHENKLKRLGVPIYTSHTILSANGTDRVESITVGKLDSDWNLIKGTEKSFLCDTILIAVGLDPVNEFYDKALGYGIKVWMAGDAQEIAEASAAIFTGRMEAIKILHSYGIETDVKIEELEKKAQILKAPPPPPKMREIPTQEEGIFPIFHCDQEIPCNPCISVCPQHQIFTENDLLTSLPYFKGEEDCTGCGRCVAVCPGLAISLVDYRKDKEFPYVTFPHEMAEKSLKNGDKIIVVSDTGELGVFFIELTRKLKQYPRTQLVTVKLPKQIAKCAIGIKIQANEISGPLSIYHKPPLADEAIVCRCERVSAGEIRKWIQQGITDVNQLKALTHVQMGACGGKTCTAMINRIFSEEGVPFEQITQGTRRPLFIEVPLGIFAHTEDVK